MAVVVNHAKAFPLAAGSPFVDAIIDATPDANVGFVLVKYTVSAATGGTIRCFDIGLVSCEGVLGGANTTFDDASPTAIVAGNTNGDHYFIAWGQMKGETQNFNAALVDPG